VATGLISQLDEELAPLVTREQLLRVHEASYIDNLFDNSPAEGNVVALDPDTVMCWKTLDAARRAAGATVHAVDRIMKGSATRAFCNVRPPGHHATPDQAMGFCFFNNLAVGVAHALASYEIKRIAVIDFDIHHGNGTEACFLEDARVKLCSTYERNNFASWFAYTSHERNIDIAVPPPVTGSRIKTVYQDHFLPALEQFKPQLVFVSAGFDGHRDDPLSNGLLDEDDYGWITRQIVTVANRHANGRIISVLEGGYDLAALARSAARHIAALLDAGSAQ
jgi:acetoin utilization deacetylase AcuC-like enzyme